jgi:hypothetical protein
VDLYGDFLELYIEIMLGAVAFMTVVATLRQTLGKPMPPYQYLVVRFLVEVGLSHVFLAMAALGLAYSALPDSVALKWTVYAFAGFTSPYLLFYIYRRTRRKAPTPFIILLVMLGYISMVITLLLSALGLYVTPSIEVIVVYLLWVFLAHIVIFFVFLGTFFRMAEASSAD